MWLQRNPVVINLYYVYRYKTTTYIRGRILQNKKIQITNYDSAWKSFKNFIRSLNTRELRHRPLTITIDHETFEFKTDQEGYIDAIIENKDSKVISISTDGGASVTGEVIAIASSTEFGIISDIDDTILVTGVASRFKWRVITNTLFKNPWSRSTFESSTNLFHALKNGSHNSNNPIFYISNSPWNIFDYLKNYLAAKNFPDGILLLRDIDISLLRRKQLEKRNKYKEVVRTIESCPGLPFILIGDAGEVDMDIYHAIYQKYEKRILAIYIRDVKKSKRRANVISLMEQLPNTHVLLFSDATEVMEHARNNEFIAAAL